MLYHKRLQHTITVSQRSALLNTTRVADGGMWGGLMTAWVKGDKYNLEGKRN